MCFVLLQLNRTWKKQSVQNGSIEAVEPLENRRGSTGSPPSPPPPTTIIIMIRSTNYGYACRRIHLVNYRRKVTPISCLFTELKWYLRTRNFIVCPKGQTNFIQAMKWNKRKRNHIWHGGTSHWKNSNQHILTHTQTKTETFSFDVNESKTDLIEMPITIIGF